MIALANSPTSRVDLVAKGFKDSLPRGWFFVRSTGNFQSDRQSEIYTPDALRSLASVGSEQTYTVVPHELRQKFCYPEVGVKTGETIRCAKSNCYRGWNGQNHESDDTERAFGEAAAALPERWC
jgi:hypothetical protein